MNYLRFNRSFLLFAFNLLYLIQQLTVLVCYYDNKTIKQLIEMQKNNKKNVKKLQKNKLKCIKLLKSFEGNK